MGGQGSYDLPKFLRLMQRKGWTGALCSETSVHVQGHPDYDSSAAAEQTYRATAAVWKEAGIPTD